MFGLVESKENNPRWEDPEKVKKLIQKYRDVTGDKDMTDWEVGLALDEYEDYKGIKHSDYVDNVLYAQHESQRNPRYSELKSVNKIDIDNDDYNPKYNYSDWIDDIIMVIIFGVFILLSFYYRQNLSRHFGEGDNSDKKEKDKEDEEYEYEDDRDKDYGKILNLKGKVDLNAIHKAYRNKIKEYHPDKIETMADELKELALKRTKEINEAYKYFKEKYG